jgi:hypothetical protein
MCVCVLLQTPAAPLRQQKRLLNPRKGGVAAQNSPLKKKVALQQHHTVLGSSKALFSDAPGEHYCCALECHCCSYHESIARSTAACCTTSIGTTVEQRLIANWPGDR